jgi:branched-chain amino acid transport system substrate-binding protein
MGWDPAIATHFQFVIVGALIMFFLIVEPHGLARLWALSEGETEIVALPALRGARWAGSPALRTWSARGLPRDDNPGRTRGEHIGSTKGRNTPMKKLATMALAGMMAASPALADLVFPSLSYRTGAYAAGGIPFADGYQDYFTLLNQRDGGIGGVMIRVVECETAYNTERGVECYESTKGEGALVYQPLSTGITYQLIPRATADGIPLHTMGYGRTSAANGDVFSHVFNYPANYWDAASVIVNQLLEENDGSLEGKTIALLYHNSAYGREPIRTLETLAEMHGFSLTQIAVDHPGQEQGNQWLQIRRERPDYVVMWGWGVMNQVAVQEAINIRYPMENFIGNWWAGADHDVEQAGEAAAGYRSLNMNRLGDMPIFAEIQEHVHDAGLASGDGTNLG